ncbi:MAG: glycerol-3-phosphate acyltransferase [Anaerolineales bacterium]|jgi:glycerol-3-phosphate acyltransferase PlsY|nr:glycerol-3-phosphate acyltransferase [Anaerolineales bacterium]
MQFLLDAGLVLLGYLVGSIPFGLIIVKLKTGKDIRTIESGRTGGTNALRAAGLGAGLATALMDILKSAAVVWIAQALTQTEWVYVLAPVAAILGHNYSAYLPEFDANGKFKRLRGGAGGGPAAGGALGLWPVAGLIVIPVGALVFFGLGYASVTTISVGLTAIIVFAVRAWLGYSPWIYVWYGVLAEILLLWALRPNLKKLLNGTERVVSLSLHGRIKARKEQISAEEAVQEIE